MARPVLALAALLAAVPLAGCVAPFDGEDGPPEVALEADPPMVFAGGTVLLKASFPNGRPEGSRIEFDPGDGNLTTTEDATLEYRYMVGGIHRARVTLLSQDDEPLAEGEADVTVNERGGLEGRVARSPFIDDHPDAVLAGRIPWTPAMEQFRVHFSLVGTDPRETVVTVRILADGRALVEEDVALGLQERQNVSFEGRFNEPPPHLIEVEAQRGSADVRVVVEMYYAAIEDEGDG